MSGGTAFQRLYNKVKPEEEKNLLIWNSKGYMSNSVHGTPTKISHILVLFVNP
jgi:hypothetical protein